MGPFGMPEPVGGTSPAPYATMVYGGTKPSNLCGGVKYSIPAIFKTVLRLGSTEGAKVIVRGGAMAAPALGIPDSPVAGTGMSGATPDCPV